MSTIQIADKPTLDEILTLLENTTYGLNALKTALSNGDNNIASILNNTTYGLSALNTDIDKVQSTLNNTTYGLSAIKTYVDTLESTIGVTSNTGGSASAGTVMAKLNALFSLVSNTGGIPGTVKSIQRGISKGSVDGVTITINAINANKAIVLFDAAETAESDHNVFAPYVTSLTSTVLKVAGGYTWSGSASSMTFGWQVIDFY